MTDKEYAGRMAKCCAAAVAAALLVGAIAPEGREGTTQPAGYRGLPEWTESGNFPPRGPQQGAAGPATAAAILGDPGQVHRWPDAALDAAASGDPGAAELLIEFIEGRGTGPESSEPMYRGRSTALSALGYLIRAEGGNRRAERYLAESTERASWIQRRIRWLGREPYPERRMRGLTAAAAAGLAFSGTAEAGRVLGELAETGPQHLRGTAEQLQGLWRTAAEQTGGTAPPEEADSGGLDGGGRQTGQERARMRGDAPPTLLTHERAWTTPDDREAGCPGTETSGDYSYALVEPGLINELADLEGGWPKMIRFATGINLVSAGAPALDGRITSREPTVGGDHYLLGVTHRACSTGYEGEQRCADADGQGSPALTGTLALGVSRGRLVTGQIEAPDGRIYNLCALTFDPMQTVVVTTAEPGGGRAGR